MKRMARLFGRAVAVTLAAGFASLAYIYLTLPDVRRLRVENPSTTAFMELRARDARVPLLFITGWGLREEDHARLAGLGVRRCLFKPVRPDELDGALQDAVAPR